LARLKVQIPATHLTTASFCSDRRGHSDWWHHRPLGGVMLIQAEFRPRVSGGGGGLGRGAEGGGGVGGGGWGGVKAIGEVAELGMAVVGFFGRPGPNRVGRSYSWPPISASRLSQGRLCPRDPLGGGPGNHWRLRQGRPAGGGPESLGLRPPIELPLESVINEIRERGVEFRLLFLRSA